MNARKCDRCKKYYDKNKRHNRFCGVLCGIGFVNEKRMLYQHSVADLCDDCLSELKEFMKIGEEKEEHT